jgi:hypothetical protein
MAIHKNKNEFFNIDFLNEKYFLFFSKDLKSNLKKVDRTFVNSFNNFYSFHKKKERGS